MPILLNHKWPGNVRELENVIERAVLLAEDTILMPEHFSIMSGKLVGLHEEEEVFEGYSLKAAQKVLEKKFIKKALAETSGNRTKASRILEISHPSLLSKMKAYNITDV